MIYAFCSLKLVVSKFGHCQVEPINPEYKKFLRLKMRGRLIYNRMSSSLPLPTKIDFTRKKKLRKIDPILILTYMNRFIFLHRPLNKDEQREGVKGRAGE